MNKRVDIIHYIWNMISMESILIICIVLFYHGKHIYNGQVSFMLHGGHNQIVDIDILFYP